MHSSLYPGHEQGISSLDYRLGNELGCFRFRGHSIAKLLMRQSAFAQIAFKVVRCGLAHEGGSQLRAVGIL